MSKFDINDNKMNPFTHESKSSVKKADGDLMLLKMNTSSNEELIELNILRSSAQMKLANTELNQNMKRMHDLEHKTYSDAHD